MLACLDMDFSFDHTCFMCRAKGFQSLKSSEITVLN